MTIRLSILAAPVLIAALSGPALAEDLYRPSNFPAMSSDDRASAVGDALTVVIFQAAEATNSAQRASRRKTDIGGSIGTTFGLDEEASLEFGGGYTGRGEVRRTERFVTQLSVVVRDVLPNGDFVIDGEQWMRINGETTRIGVRGRVRRADIRADNSVLSSRIANAQINYDGRGFVSRSAKPGLINRIFNFLGLV